MQALIVKCVAWQPLATSAGQRQGCRDKHQPHMAVGMEKQATAVVLLGFRLVVLLHLQYLHCYQSALLQDAVMFATLCSSSSNRHIAGTSLLWQHCSFPAWMLVENGT